MNPQDLIGKETWYFQENVMTRTSRCAFVAERIKVLEWVESIRLFLCEILYTKDPQNKVYLSEYQIQKGLDAEVKNGSK